MPSQGLGCSSSSGTYLGEAVLGGSPRQAPPGQGMTGHPALGLPAPPASQPMSTFKVLGATSLCGQQGLVQDKYYLDLDIWGLDRPRSQTAWVPGFKSSLCICQRSNCGSVF